MASFTSILYHPVSSYSVGIEDVKDLIQDLKQALDKIWHPPGFELNKTVHVWTVKLI